MIIGWLELVCFHLADLAITRESKGLFHGMGN